MKNHIRVLDRDRIQVDVVHGWTEDSQICVSLGEFNTIAMSRDRALALMRCLDDVVNASAFDEPIGGPAIGGPAIDELDEFREEADDYNEDDGEEAA